jgi:Putative DNA-binding domain
MDRAQTSDFAEALLDPGLPGPAIVSRNPADRDRRLNIYRNNVRASLIDALAATFPVVQALVGDDFFRAMAGVHAQASPPRSRVLATYGGDFPSFLGDFAPVANLPYLPDVARLEWLRVQSHHAADATALGAGHFQDLLADPDTLLALRIDLHPACRWVTSAFAAFSIWQAHQHEAPHLSAIDLAEPQEMVICRPAHEVRVLPLPTGAAAWLDALSRGETLAEAIGAALARAPEFDVSRALALLIEHGLAVRLSPAPGKSA